MDNFLKQQRLQFSGLGEENEDDVNKTREGKIPARKKVSFTGDRKKAQNWYQRQFSGQMSEDNSDGEFATAIAAAAFAITAQEERVPLDQKQPVEELERPPPIKTKTKREESGKLLRWLSGKEAKEDGRPSDDSSMRRSTTMDRKMLEDSAAEYRAPEKAISRPPSIKKAPTFPSKNLNDTGSKKFERGEEQAGRQATPPMKPTASFPGRGNGGRRTNSTAVETKSDAWTEARMEKIQKRYEKTNTTILEWENERRTKAKRRLERKERELERRRVRALKEYRDEMSRIDKITAEARALAKERKRNDESKAIEKAKKMRSTGKDSHLCPCF